MKCTRYVTPPRWSFLLLLGGLTGCGYDVDGDRLAASLGAEPAGPGEEGPREPEAAPRVGMLAERFVQHGYGAAFTIKAYDIDGDGSAELLYGGNALVALDADDQPIWTFALSKGAEEAGIDTERGESDEARRLEAVGPYVRAVHPHAGDLFVTDSNNRLYRLNAADGSLIWEKKLEGDGEACSLTLFDGDGDDIPDVYPSGGKTAYAGRTGQALFDVDIRYAAGLVKAGDLDGNEGDELLVIRSSGAPGLCPDEEATIRAIHGDDQQAPTIRAAARLSQPKIPAALRERLAPKQASGAMEGPNLYVVDTNGEELLERQIPGEIYSAHIGKIGGKPAIVLGTNTGISVLDGQGNPMWDAPIGYVAHVSMFDVDGDGNEELVANTIVDGKSTFYALDAEGNQLWSYPVDARVWGLDAVDVNDDGYPELVGALGYGSAGDPEIAQSIAWEVGPDGAMELWRFGSNMPARGFAYAARESGGQLYIAGGDAILRTVDPNDGTYLNEWKAGGLNHFMTTGDLDGDGLAETITGDIYGNFVISDAQGERRYGTRFDAMGAAVVTGIDIHDGTGGAPGMFVATGYAWRTADKGVIEAFDADGNSLFAATTPNGLGDVKLADLDGDGNPEIIAATWGFRMPEEAGTDAKPTTPNCGVIAWSSDGKELWNAETETCDLSRMSVGDVDGDGKSEVAFGTFGKEGPYTVTLLDGSGSTLWSVSSDSDDAVWIAVTEGGVAYGGRSGDKDGHVTFLGAEDGAVAWRNEIVGEPPSEAPEMKQSPFGAFAGSLFGIPVGDVNGDGDMDIAYSTVAGEVVVVDHTGETIWSGSLQMKDRDYIGGPLALVERADGSRLLMVAGYDFAHRDSNLSAYQMRDGVAAGAVRLDGYATGVDGSVYEPGAAGVVVATTYDTYGFALGTERPRPLPRPGTPGSK